MTLLSQGILLITVSQKDPLLVNGHEICARFAGAHLLTGLFLPRKTFDDAAGGPQSGDMVGMRVRADLVAAYEVRAAGPGVHPAAAGALEPDGVACEWRQDLGSLHKLLQELRPLTDNSLH